MGRPVILGNGGLTIGLNEHGLVHDFYYPYVGLDNLTNARSVHHKIGIFVDGQFSWVDDGSWETSVDFESDALVSIVTLRHKTLGIELHFSDFIDSEHDAFCRQITIKNTFDDSREIRLFMHQVFQISRAGRADTALYVPDEHYILDYKGYCSLLIYGQVADGGDPYDQFAVGNYGIEGKEGTFRDAEDGELSGSAVEHGGVDSVIRLKTEVAGGQSVVVDYWIVAATTQVEAERIHVVLRHEGLTQRLKMTRNKWQQWFMISANKLHGIDREYLEAVKKSLLVIKAHTDKHGGVIASCDSSIYNYGRDYYSYVWPRDGAYALWPLIRMGYTEEARRFFRFCSDILNPDGYLMHKYQPDRAIGSTWHPLLHGDRKELAIQEDETAIVIYMLGEYQQYSGDIEFIKLMYEPLIKPAANFMSKFFDDTGLPHASYDLWEEKFLTNTYTTAVTYQALIVAAEIATQLNHPEEAALWNEAAERMVRNSGAFIDPERHSLRKGFLLQTDGSLKFDNTLDVSSMYGVMMFDLFQNNDDIVHDTVRQIESTLLDKTPSGGTPRYEFDNYFTTSDGSLGNPWFVTTLWVAQYYIRTHQDERARRYLSWALDKRLPSGVFAEQVHPEFGAPISVAPLVWSHAEFINTVLDLGHRK